MSNFLKGLLAIFFCFCVAIFCIIYFLVRSSNHYQEKCEAAGGVVIKGYGHRYCVDKSVVIEVDD